MELHISVYLYRSNSGPVKIIGFISLGGHVYWTENPDPAISPDAMIDVSYENAADFNETDLQLAAEQAIMTSQELWYIKSLPISGPKGCVSLVPRANWRGHERSAVAIVKDLISYANRELESQKTGVDNWPSCRKKDPRHEWHSVKAGVR